MKIFASLTRAFGFVFLCFALSGCAEIQKIISVMWAGRINVNTSMFDILEMSSGDKVTCSIMGDKTIRCLGSTINGNLGRFYGAQNNNLKEVRQVALGNGFTCAIMGERSELKCFGLNDHGQLGNGTQTASVEPLPVLDSENNNTPVVDAKQIAAGEFHACALLKSGRAICWGDNSFGQGGNPNATGFQTRTVMENERTPKPFAGIQTIVAGGNSTCVVAQDDLSLFCFGQRYGSIRKLNWVPEKIDVAGRFDVLADIKQVALGNNFGCALTRSQVYCWGVNDQKQLGSSPGTPGLTKAAPVEVRFPTKGALSKIESIAVGDQHACAIHRDEGTVYCWGNNQYGQLGTTSTHGLPEQVAVSNNNLSLKGAKFIAAGKGRTCVISRSDDLFCWGNGINGILGSNTISTTYPTRVVDSNNDFVTGAVSIAIGSDHACVLGTNKKIYCFGMNQFGQVGSRMIASSTLEGVYSMNTYGERTCVIHGEKKSVACFGGPSSFALEEITNNGKPYHDAVGTSSGQDHLCIITSDQQVECIDYATKPPNHYIVQNEKKAPLKDIWQIHSRNKLNCGLTRDKGEVWCWGDWKNHQWPNAKQMTFAGKPTSDFIQIAVSEDQICGIHGVTGSVYCTVDAESNANTTNLQSVSDSNGKAFSGVFYLTGGKNHLCALNDRNQLFCWGSNEFGQLGSQKLETVKTPQEVKIPEATRRKVVRVSAGDDHTCFTTDIDLSLFCFGKSFFNEGISTNPVEYPL